MSRQHDPEQREQLERVSGKLEPLVREFFRRRIERRELSFRNVDLLMFVTQKGVVCAPDSPARVMRALCSERVISYEVVNRTGSVYKINVPGEPDPQRGLFA